MNTKETFKEFFKILLKIFLIPVYLIKTGVFSVVDLEKRWKEGDTSQKASIIISGIILLLVLTISAVWLLEAVSMKYRYYYLSRNKVYWALQNGTIDELHMSSAEIEKTLDKYNRKNPNNPEELSEWRFKNDEIHFFFNKLPRVINFSTILFGLMILTSGIAGMNGALTSIKNFQLPTGKGNKIPRKQLHRMFFMLFCWAILFFTFLVCKKFITDIDTATNVEIIFNEETIMTGFILLCVVIAFGLGFSKISTSSQKEKTTLENNKEYNNNQQIQEEKEQVLQQSETDNCKKE